MQDRIVEVLSSKNTGEVLLDEALKVMKGSEEPMSCAQWVDLLSGECISSMRQSTPTDNSTGGTQARHGTG